MDEIDPVEGGFLIGFIEDELGARVVGRLGDTVHRILQKDGVQGIAVLLPNSVFSAESGLIEIPMDDFREYEALQQQHGCFVHLLFVGPNGKPYYRDINDAITDLAHDAIARFQGFSEA